MQGIRKLFTAIFILIFVGSNSAQSSEQQKVDSLDGWKTTGLISLNLTQVSLTNWSAGGENSISLNGIFNVSANYIKGNSHWDNSLDLAYGILQQGNDGVRKTDDKIDISTKFGQKAFKKWYYSVLLNFKSQLTSGYDYPDDSTIISDFLAPGYFIGSFGLDYKPNSSFTFLISPLTIKTTIVNDQKLADDGAYGVTPAEFDAVGNIIKNGETMRTEYGAYIRTQFKKDIMKNINLQTKLELFSNYSENPDHIDVNWELLMVLKVNKYISATISTQLIYDHDVDIAIDTNDDGENDSFGPRTQFKEILGIGLSYKF